MSVTPVRMVGARVLRAVFGVVFCTLLAAGAMAAAFSEITRTIAGTSVLSAAVAEHALLPAAVCIAVVPELSKIGVHAAASVNKMMFALFE